VFVSTWNSAANDDGKTGANVELGNKDAIMLRVFSSLFCYIFSDLQYQMNQLSIFAEELSSFFFDNSGQPLL